MRILMITGSLSRAAGGLFYSVRKLSQSLYDSGCEVHVLGLQDSYTNEDLHAWSPLQPVAVNGSFPFMLVCLRTLEQKIVDIAPDIIHLHGIWMPISLITSRWAARGIPVVVSPRGMLDNWAISKSRFKKKFAWYAYERVNLQRASCLHALNDSEAASIKSVLPRSNVTIIPNGIELTGKSFVQASPDSSRPALLFMSRIHPKKGLMEFLDLWAKVRPLLSRPWVLRIAGPDEVGHLSALRTRVVELGLHADVCFVGPVYDDAKARELGEAEAFVLPSKSEGMPMAVLEAWAARLPVFMTKECNLPEAFDAGAAIELTNDWNSLYSGLERSDLSSVGERGYQLAVDCFVWDALRPRYMEMYAQLTGNSN